MEIKVPVPALGVEDVVVEQLVRIPAANTMPIIFTNLFWNVRIKSLLQFTSGNGTRPREPGESTNNAPVVINTGPPLPQMMFTSRGVFRRLGLQSQDFDKYSELTAEGKRYSAGIAAYARWQGD
jgi:hypothetical protein